ILKLTHKLPILKRGRGNRVWDIEGKEYIDFDMSNGDALLGYGNPELVNSILGGSSNQKETIEKLKQRFSLRSVKIFSSEKQEKVYAINLARQLSGKRKIIRFGQNDLIKKCDLGEEIIAEWNNLDYLEKIVRQNYDIAAIIFEPIATHMGLILPENGFLKGVMEISKEYGIITVADEIKTGGKYYNGASGYLKIKPDIILFGRALAGSIPIGIVGINYKEEDYVRASPISIKALEVTLDELNEQSMYEMMRLNDILVKGYKDLIEDNKIKASVTSWGISGTIYFRESPPRRYSEFLEINVKKWNKYFKGMLESGIIPMNNYDSQWSISKVHTEEDIRVHLEKLNNVIKTVLSH
ncbi:MAG: aminotransferase class III-fold pyridoxal phosphate-dependent enzyme, partial [Acidianus infernus]|nr:aminotransferase class III-fold pyridoxal phosphate-dependent enzyme [Acidianus infernus]